MTSLGWFCVFTSPMGLRTFSSREHSWAELPDDGFLDGVIYRAGEGGQVYRQTLGGSDYVWMCEHPVHGWWIGHSNDPAEEIAARYPGAVIKRGQWTHPEEMAEAARITLEARWP